MTDMLLSTYPSRLRRPKRPTLSLSCLRWLQELVFAAGLALGLSGVAHAQAEFPSHSISLVVPFAAGGATDAASRILSEALGPNLGVKVIVENKPGASNQIGVNYVLGQPADGYTVLAGTTGIAVLRLVNKAFTLDLRKELVGIASVGENSTVLAISSKLPVQDLREFIKYGKDNPGKLNFGSQGSIDVLASSALAAAMGIDAVTIRYAGGGPVKAALMANVIQYSGFFAGDIAPLIASGHARAIATTGNKRHLDYPDLPTVQELTRTNFEYIPWISLFGKAGTPPPVIEKISLAAQRALRDPEVRRRIKAIGYEVPDRTPAAVNKFFSDEIDKWTKIAEESKFQPE